MPIFSTLFAIRVGKSHRYCIMDWACRCHRIVKWYTSLHKLILIINFVPTVETEWQTNGNAITIKGQKPCWTTVSYRTRSLSAADANSNGNNQPWRKAYCGIPTQVHPHLSGHTLNQNTTWAAVQVVHLLSISQCLVHQRALVKRVDSLANTKSLVWQVV